jgi:protein gp37
MYKRFKWDETIRYKPEVWKSLEEIPAGSKVFVGSTIDLFHPLCSAWNDEIFKVCRALSMLTFIFLTKCPENLPRKFPDNCWVGVSATNYKMANQARWYLGNIKATVRFLSVEPFLSPLQDRYYCPFEFTGGEINWLIIGSQTQPVKHPDKNWVDSLIKEADRYRIPVFVKEPLASHLNINRRELPR